MSSLYVIFLFRMVKQRKAWGAGTCLGTQMRPHTAEFSQKAVEVRNSNVTYSRVERRFQKKGKIIEGKAKCRLRIAFYIFISTHMTKVPLLSG
jgi:hypothetical protein